MEKAEEYRCRKLKDAGFNSIRSSHNPISKEMLRACDRIGMLVMDELSDMWLEPKNPHDYAQHFKENWELYTHVLTDDKIMVEYSSEKKEIIGYPKRMWRGGTDRGCIEAPHLTRRGEYYYIMCAEGGTGYNHCVTMGRSKSIWGPYEGDPCNPILTSVPGKSNERHDPDHLKPQYYNPDSVLQKSGHGSYVELPTGEVYLVHLCARPFVLELCCTLGRETAIQKMKWTEDGWLRMADVRARAGYIIVSRWDRVHYPLSILKMGKRQNF